MIHHITKREEQRIAPILHNVHEFVNDKFQTRSRGRLDPPVSLDEINPIPERNARDWYVTDEPVEWNSAAHPELNSLNVDKRKPFGYPVGHVCRKEDSGCHKEGRTPKSEYVPEFLNRLPLCFGSGSILHVREGNLPSVDWQERVDT